MIRLFTRGYSDKEVDPINLEIGETKRENYLDKKATKSKQGQPNLMITKYDPCIKRSEKTHSGNWTFLQKDPIFKEFVNI